MRCPHRYTQLGQRGPAGAPKEVALASGLVRGPSDRLVGQGRGRQSVADLNRLHIATTICVATEGGTWGSCEGVSSVESSSKPFDSELIQEGELEKVSLLGQKSAVVWRLRI